MIIRQEQIKARYKNLFPLNETKENLDKLLQLRVDTPNKVYIESKGIKTNAIYFTLLLKYIQKYEKLPTIEYFTASVLCELFFLQESADLPYRGLNAFKGDIIVLDYNITEMVSKKAVEIIRNLMKYYIDKGRAVWVFTRPGVPEIKDLTGLLNYSIIDLDKVIKQKTTSTTKASKKSDLF